MTDVCEHAPEDVDGDQLVTSLESHIDDGEFPCVRAKSALNSGLLKVRPGWQLTSAWDDVSIHEDLLRWSERYGDDPTGLRSFAVVFSGPVDLDEKAFEAALWDRLRSLAAKDEWRGQSYDPSVSSDPSDPHFSLSFGGRAYFVVGMHPKASRSARRTPYPTLVFNLHDQFEKLRAEQRYEKLRKAILDRDEQLDGSVNPMLARHGEASEARQYSGRSVGEDWECPFSDPRQ
ncbi:MAG: guanitoxin biosynthesis heme-dependent pre-guanitoxin N-hydroxylase GntA [Parvularcula sp.]|jgi:FPC/CPF motif-containing protein YcgG|nr:guanitoxin biosynthesis heme-dependent pre-guanitoxin N-hydroxylase GntA [Parvularcula sp.]